MFLASALACSAPACTQSTEADPTPGQTFGTPTTTEPGTSEDAGTIGTGSDDTGSDDTGETTSGIEDTGGGLILDVASADSGGTIPEVAEVFGHSGDILYRLDPDTNEVEIIGPFMGCTASIIDIALDANSQMYGTAFGSLWSIDRTSAQCTLIARGSYPTSLSFVPAGTVDADEEALVGFVDEEYIRIDVATGSITSLGTLSGGLASSGDMVSVNGGGSWLTVVGPGCDSGDCIIEIDPADGTVLQNYGALPYTQVFGLAFWAGRAYGFAREGTLFEIEFSAGNVVTTPIPIPVAPADLEFFGAGSTTSAPPAEG